MIDRYADRIQTAALTEYRPISRLITGLCSVFCILYSSTAFAVDYASTGATTEQIVQTRVGADFTKKWKSGVRLSISEELRFNLMDNITGTTAKGVVADTSYGASFNKS